MSLVFLFRTQESVKRKQGKAEVGLPHFLSTLSRVLLCHSMFLKLDRNMHNTVLISFY